uniref:Uncharacterized protein n=1 Tax=Meloidogyne enterolobii TaxID=390850 RepID=A0A6V7TRQ9_MELEN|nr:unnamed protein product [Meloidogyne enterolobii]
METEFKNPLNVPIVFRFRIAFLSCIWEGPRINPIRFRILRHVVNEDSRTALIDKENNDLDGKILNVINRIANYKILYNKSQQENKLTEFGLMETIEGLLKQLVPISKENDLPWEQAKDKVYQLMRIIKDLEYGERKFSTKVTKKIGSILVKMILKLEITEVDRNFSNNLRDEMSYEEFNFEEFTYMKIINKNLEEFMEKLDFSEFIPLKQIIKIDLVTISDKVKKFLESVYLPTNLHIKLFFYFLLSYYVDLLDKGGEKRIKYFENINLVDSNLSEGFTYIYTADWLQNALMIPLEEEIHDYVRFYIENSYEIILLGQMV